MPNEKDENIQPKMSDLPFARLEPMKPPLFSTGIDLFEPVMIKQQQVRLKRWGALFNCFTTRTTYLEVVEGYDTNRFIGSLAPKDLSNLEMYTAAVAPI